MMPVTKRGIYHNLKESNYMVSNTEIVFYFSSKIYLTKFIKGYNEHRKNFVHHLSKVSSENPLNMETLADIAFYKSIEKRGFRSLLKGVDISCDELHKYALRKMTDRNSPVWSEIQRLRLEERLKIME